MKKSALLVAYNALMAIGAIDEGLHSQMWCFARARYIAAEAMRQLHVDYTADVQRALGMGSGNGKVGKVARKMSARSVRR